MHTRHNVKENNRRGLLRWLSSVSFCSVKERAFEEKRALQPQKIVVSGIGLNLVRRSLAALCFPSNARFLTVVSKVIVKIEFFLELTAISPKELKSHLLNIICVPVI